MNLVTVIDFVHEVPASDVKSATPCRLLCTGLTWREENSAGGVLDLIRPIVLSFN